MKHNKYEIVLVCRVEGNHLTDIKWYRNNKKLENTTTISISFHKIILKRPTANDNGNYHCEATNKKGMARSKMYRLEIDNDNDGDQNTKRINGLRCAHKNFIEHNGKPKTVPKKGEHHGKHLLLCRTKRSGVDQKPAELLRQSAHRRQVTVNEKQFAVLACDLKNGEKKMAKLSVKWKKNEKLFRQGDINAAKIEPVDPAAMENPLLREDGRVSVSNKNGSLVFSAAIPSDSGTYECQVYRNSENLVNVQITELNIVEELKFTPQPTSKHLEIGNVGKVHCKAQGTPTPQIRWTREGFDKLPASIEDINGTLTFNNVSEADKGNYICTASNKQGTITAMVTINAVVAPKFVTKPFGSIEVNEMNPVMIHCTAIGDPKPTIQWDKDLVYLNINNSVTSRLNVLENGTLHFTEVHLDDEGVYGCTIGNSAGLKREDVRLIVKRKLTLMF